LNNDVDDDGSDARPEFRSMSTKISGNTNAICRVALLAVGDLTASAGERGQNEQPSADQESKPYTAEDRESTMCAMSRFGFGGGSVRRSDIHPEVTHNRLLP
jgi:hypothetical protein